MATPRMTLSNRSSTGPSKRPSLCTPWRSPQCSQASGDDTCRNSVCPATSAGLRSAGSGCSVPPAPGGGAISATSLPAM